MFYHLEDERPVVLVITEPGLSITNFIVDYLKANALEIEVLCLDQRFFLEYEQIADKIQRIYKIIVVYGFDSNSAEVYQRIFNFLDLLNNKQGEKIPIVLISPISTSLEILDDFVPAYQQFLVQQTTFLQTFLARFEQSLVFLAQDILLDKKKIDYPLLLFFSAIKKGYLLDLQVKFYFQDERSFFNLIKEYLIKPHDGAKFIVKGAAISSSKTLAKIAYLYEQYFQKKPIIIKLFADERKNRFLQEFAVVNNSKPQLEELIDQRVREIVNFDKEIALIAPSDRELQKALAMEQLQQERQFKKQLKLKQAIPAQDFTSNEVLDLLKQAQKEPAQESEAANSDSEFIKKIENLFSTQRRKEKKNRQEKNIVKGKEIIKKSKKRKVLFYLGIFGFGLSFLLFSLFFIFTISQQKIKNQLFTVVKNNGEEIEKFDESRFNQFFNFQLDQYLKILSADNFGEALDLRELNAALLALSAGRKESQDKAYDLYKKTFTGGIELKQFYEELDLAIDKKIEGEKAFNAYLSSLNLDLYQGEEKSVWQKSLDTNKAELKNDLQLKRFFGPFKDFIFQPGRINLLILVQDSSELRSTGGFLTEAITLSFDNAVLIDKQVLDVNDLDSRIYGRKEPPEEIKNMLGEEVFYLRDSNWQADFAQSNQEIKWFVEQATGSKIDLTVALNTKTISEILKVVDGVELANDGLINTINYLERQEKAASLDYKSVNSEKFSWRLINALLDKISQLTQSQFVALNKLLIKDLNQKEILLQVNDQNLQQIIEANSWSGEKVIMTCPAEFKQENCLLDSLFQVENNVGVNKINPYIKETIEHNLGIGKDFIRHKRKITFENFAKSNTWPLGAYHDFLKFYLNSQASLEKIEIDGQPLEEEKFKVADIENGKEISLLLEIPTQSKIELEITYLIPNQMQPPFSYVFLDQKQAGVFAKETAYNIVFDEQFKPQLIAPSAIYQDKIIRFNNSNTDHFLFAINFSE